MEEKTVIIDELRAPVIPDYVVGLDYRDTGSDGMNLGGLDRFRG